MTNVLQLPGRPEAPIACDLSTARDTPGERIAEYRELFGRSLLSRQRRADAVVLAFRADPGTRERIEDLARREQACCPFLESRIETAGDEVIWTIANVVTGDDRPAVDAFLDEFYALPERRTRSLSP